MVNTVKKSNSSFGQLLLIAVSVLFVAGLSLLVLEKAHITNIYSKPITVTTAARPVNSVDYSQPTTSDSNNQKTSTTGSTNKADIIDQQQNGTTTSSNISINITEASQSDSTVYVRALISGTTTGTCNLTLKNGQNTITKSAAVGAQANYVICQGFNIPVSEFLVSGTWQVQININGTNAAANTAVEVKK